MPGFIYYNTPAETISDAIRYYLKGVIEGNPDYIEVTDVSMGSLKELLLSLSARAEQDRVVYFPKAEEIESRTQDVLLKVLEDRADIIFFFKSERRMIPTIESRCRIFNGTRKSREDYLEWLEAEYGTNEEWLYYFTGGDADVTEQVMQDNELQKSIRHLEKTGFGDKKELLKTFSLLKEKDENSFFSLHRDYVKNLYMLFEHMLFDMLLKDAETKQLVKSLSLVEKHMVLERGRAYTANDMIDLLLGVQT